ncbi:MAG: hypothetical protein ACOYU7_04235 [Bacillota bacterium]
MKHQFIESENVVKIADGTVIDLDTVAHDIYYYIKQDKKALNFTLSFTDSVVLARELLAYLSVCNPWAAAGRSADIPPLGDKDYVLKLQSSKDNCVMELKYGEGVLLNIVNRETGETMTLPLDADACILFVAAIMRGLLS